MHTFDERRVATVLFVDMCGYSAFIGDEDPEDVARVLGQLKELASSVVESCGGIVNQFVGDEIVALFGVHKSHEDDARRAVTAALMLHERARAMSLSRSVHRPCLLHSGIETGLVLARARDLRAGVYDVIGEPVNLGARLRSQAGPDEILLGPRTWKQVAPYFDVEPIESFVPRGMSQTIRPARVLRASSAQNTFDAALRHGLTDYIGREGELTRMIELARSVEQARQGACLAVAGAPGMGKTRLFYEAQKRVRSVLARLPVLLVGRCSALTEAPAYHPFVDALHKLRAELSGDSVDAFVTYGEELRPHLPVFAYLLDRAGDELPLSGERLREAIVDALAALLSALSRERLVLVVLEDWHWADEASCAALRQLVARASEQSVLFAVNHRSAELPAGGLASTTSFELAPLDYAESAEMAALSLEAAFVPDELSAHIHERTQGNPFFIEETCRSLLETGAVVHRGAGVLLACPVSELSTPSSVQAMVRARIDRLQPADKELLRLASVLGSEFAEDLLLVLARASRLTSEYAEGTEEELRARLQGQLAQLEQSGLIYRTRGEGARHRFKHAITCEVAYADLPRDERRAHHARIGLAIEARGELSPWYAQLAYHFGESPSLDKAVLYAERAADHALRAFSLQQAMKHYRSAIAGLDQTAEGDVAQQHKRVALSLKWAACSVFNPARDQLSVLERSLHWARARGDLRNEVRCLCWMGWLAHAVGDQVRAIELYQTALEQARPLRDATLRAQVQGNIGLSYAMAARHGEARAALEQSVAARASHASGAGYGYALANLALVVGDQGELERAHELFEAGLAAIGETGREAVLGTALVLRAMVEAWQRDFSACMRTATQVRDIADRTSGGYLRAMSDTLAGACQVFGAGQRAGIDQLHAAVRWLDMHRIEPTMSWNEAWLAEALAHVGQYDEAEVHASRALVRTSAWDALGEVAARRVRARVYFERDREPFRAERELQFAQDAAERKGSPRELALNALARACLHQRQGGVALAHDAAVAKLRALGIRVNPASDWFG